MANTVVAGIEMDPVILGLLAIMFLLRRPLLRHWRGILPTTACILGAVIFVNWFLRSEGVSVPPLVLLLMIVIVAVWIYRIGRDVFK